MMRLNGPFRIVITGDTHKILSREAAGEGIGVLMQRLLTGLPIDGDDLSSWRMTLEVVPEKMSLKGPRGRLPG